MTTTHDDKNDSHDPRMSYIPLGVDGRGYHHIAQIETDTVHVIAPTGARERYHLHGRSLDAYMDAVAEEIGWTRRDYGVGFAELVARGLNA